MPVRLDLRLVELGLARSRSQAATLIKQGRVRQGERVLTRAATPVEADAELVVDGPPVYVSRAAYKLLGALDAAGIASQITVGPRVLDAGSSTGGFTQVLLERGAERVYAVDVGTDQLAPELRADPRIVVWEQTNLRGLELSHVENEPVDLVVADVSFISLTMLLEPLFGVLAEHGQALLMVKPQFEVGRERLGSGGVVRDEALRLRAVAAVEEAAERLGWRCAARSESVLPGPAGNHEYFCLFVRQ